MCAPAQSGEVEIRTDLDSGALVLTLQPSDSRAEVRAAVDSCAGQHPAAVVLDLGPAPTRWFGLLRGLARVCGRHAVPLLVVPALVSPTPPAVRSMVPALPMFAHASVAEALASLPGATLPPSHRRQARLTPEPAEVGRARALAAATLLDWGLDQLAFPVELITSELVSNAVRHAGTPADLLLRRYPPGVRVAVRDADPTPPRVPTHTPDLNREGGRGLMLVAASAHRWGVLRGSRDKIVWADVGGEGAGPGQPRSPEA
jgi:anti-sigma regulatory factor (Ser/Thr protein kinase)